MSDTATVARKVASSDSRVFIQPVSWCWYMRQRSRWGITIAPFHHARHAIPLVWDNDFFPSCVRNIGLVKIIHSKSTLLYLRPPLESSTLSNLTPLSHLPYNTYRVSTLSAQKLFHGSSTSPSCKMHVFHQSGLYKAPRATSPALSSLVRATMTYDNTLYRILKISELTRLIASQLVFIGAEKSAVNLACACRQPSARSERHNRCCSLSWGPCLRKLGSISV